MKIKFLKAKLTDIPKMQDLIHPEVESGIILERSNDEVATNIRSYTLAYIGDELIGFTALHIHTIELAEIRSLIIKDGFRGQKIGESLVNEAIKEGKSLGLKRVLMFISDDFSGMSEAINTLFPLSDIQKCIIHLDRNLYRNMQKDDARYVTKKLHEIKATCDTFEEGLAIYQRYVIDKFKQKYPTFIKHLDKRKEEHMAFLKYPESTRKHIYTTNPVESVHSSFEKMRIKKGGFFQSMDTLNVAIFIVCDKLTQLSDLKPSIF